MPTPQRAPAAAKTRYRPIRGAGGALVAGHPLAAAAGMQVLDRGENAVDAAGYRTAMLDDWAELAVEGANPVTVGSAKAIAVDAATGVRSLGVDPCRDAYGAVR